MAPSKRTWDTLRLRNWSIRTGIGAYDFEQSGTQELVLDLSVGGDFRIAGLTDDLSKALDYAVLRQSIEDWLGGKRWQLLEAFAESLCSFVLERELVREVELIVEKPAAQAPVVVSYHIFRSK